MATVSYYNDSFDLLAKAKSELSWGDTRQASEKAWGATALMLKHIAEQKGQPHQSHRNIWQVATGLTAETSNREIYRLFRVANHLHSNFYEDADTAADVAESIGDVERLLDILGEYARTIGPR
jgi:hypothetical protein